MKVLWTDGSAKPNPGPGGFAVIENGMPVCLGREDNTTNNRMEGLAIATAIKYAGDEECEIHSDSEYWIKTLTEWAPKWRENDWKTAAKKPIKNEELVKSLYELYTSRKVKLVWVRGHVGTELNEMADEWAMKARLAEVPGEYEKVETAGGGVFWKRKGSV